MARDPHDLVAVQFTLRPGITIEAVIDTVRVRRDFPQGTPLTEMEQIENLRQRVEEGLAASLAWDVLRRQLAKEAAAFLTSNGYVVPDPGDAGRRHVTTDDITPARLAASPSVSEATSSSSATDPGAAPTAG